MRRFKDSLATFRFTSMMPVLHLSFLITFAIFGIRDSTSSCPDWQAATKLLMWMHTISSFFFLFQPVLIKFKQTTIAGSIEYVLTLAYHAILIYTQYVYNYFDNDPFEFCSTLLPKQSQWMDLEMATYYSLILSAFIQVIIEFFKTKECEASIRLN